MAIMTEALERVFKVREVAVHLGIADGLVYAMVQRGELRAIRTGRLVRIPESALRELLAGANQSIEPHPARTTDELV